MAAAPTLAASRKTFLSASESVLKTPGFMMIVAGEYPTWGLTVQTLVVSLIALHQLIGPVLFRAALSRAGEIGRMDAAG